MSTPKCLWRPTPEAVEASSLASFTHAMQRAYPQQNITDYPSLHRWSVEHAPEFWTEALKFLELKVSGSTAPATSGQGMPGTRFFPETRLNFAENLLRFANKTPDAEALVSLSESRPRVSLTYAELKKQVTSLATTLQSWGVTPGDRVAAFVPNCHESVVVMLASAQLGATFTSCSPDFGFQGVVDRFGQAQPKVLVATTGYVYGGKTFDVSSKVLQLTESISSIEHIILIDFVSGHNDTFEGAPKPVHHYETLVTGDTADAVANYAQFPFDHPLFIMYSSGTTGIPKCIVHGAGGTLLQHAKELVFHCDLRAGDRILYFTTCGWMMWNWLVSSLFVGSTVVLYDGSPAFPDIQRLWEITAGEELTHLGTSPKFLGACRGKLVPKVQFRLENLRVLMSTGAPLLPEDFDWVYTDVKEDIQLSSIAGGTDIISCFMLGNPTLPVYRGEIQALGLGMDVVAMSPEFEAVFQAKGELVCRTPFPSMPVKFWNDENDEKYRAAYFSRLADHWFHGDFIEVTRTQGDAGGIVVYGRSDATLNPGGVRIGTAELYRVVETMPEIDDAIVVGQPFEGDVRIVLFVVVNSGHTLDDALRQRIKKQLRQACSPRHVPARIEAVAAVPYTISGKKVELAVLQTIQGLNPGNEAALKNPESLRAFADLAESLAEG